MKTLESLVDIGVCRARTMRTKKDRVSVSGANSNDDL